MIFLSHISFRTRLTTSNTEPDISWLNLFRYFVSISSLKRINLFLKTQISVKHLWYFQETITQPPAKRSVYLCEWWLDQTNEGALSRKLSRILESIETRLKINKTNGVSRVTKVSTCSGQQKQDHLSYMKTCLTQLSLICMSFLHLAQIVESKMDISFDLGESVDPY